MIFTNIFLHLLFYVTYCSLIFVIHSGSWKHWNNYNHPDSTYPDDDDRDRSDEGVNRESEVDEAVNQDDVDDSNKGNDARQDKRPEDSVLPTEMDNQLSGNYLFRAQFHRAA